MSCFICFSSLLKNSPKLNDCNCLFCSDCLLTWIHTEINNLSFQIGSSLIKCPNEDCKKSYSIQYLKELLNDNSKDSFIDTILAKKYCQTAPDIRFCPNSKCQNIGFLPPNKCDYNMKCELCQNEWEEYSNFTYSKKLTLFLNNEFGIKSSYNFSNYLYKELFANYCPNCSVPISKNGGCPHMKCKRCDFEFCWMCKKKYNVEGHQGKFLYCVSHFMAQLFLFLNIFNLFMNKLGLLIPICNIIVFLLLLFLEIIYFDGTIAALCLFLNKINYVRVYLKYESLRLRCLKIILYCVLAILTIFPLGYFQLVSKLIYLLLLQLMIAIIGAGSIFIFQKFNLITWINNVF